MVALGKRLIRDPYESQTVAIDDFLSGRLLDRCEEIKLRCRENTIGVPESIISIDEDRRGGVALSHGLSVPFGFSLGTATAGGAGAVTAWTCTVCGSATIST